MGGIGGGCGFEAVFGGDGVVVGGGVGGEVGHGLATLF